MKHVGEWKLLPEARPLRRVVDVEEMKECVKVGNIRLGSWKAIMAVNRQI